MRRIDDNKLDTINGGMTVATAVLIGVGISAVIVFLSGLIEGITNPERCNVWERLMNVN